MIGQVIVFQCDEISFHNKSSPWFWYSLNIIINLIHDTLFFFFLPKMITDVINKPPNYIKRRSRRLIRAQVTTTAISPKKWSQTNYTLTCQHMSDQIVRRTKEKTQHWNRRPKPLISWRMTPSSWPSTDWPCNMLITAWESPSNTTEHKPSCNPKSTPCRIANASTTGVLENSWRTPISAAANSPWLFLITTPNPPFQCSLFPCTININFKRIKRRP